MILCNRADAIQEISNTINRFADKKVFILLSGGSSASVGIGALTGVEEGLRQNITVMLADERFVDYDSPDSNGKLLRDLDVSYYCDNFINTLQSGGQTLEETVSIFRRNISFYTKQSDHVIAIFGVGSDNHIAGILPNSIAANSKELLAVGYETEKFTRITISPKFFDNITNAYIYAEGEDKRMAVDAITKENNYISHPSQLLKKCSEWDVLFNKEKL